MATLVYNTGKEQILNGGIDLDTNTIKALLIDSDYTENPDHDYVADLVADECAGTNYVRKTLAITITKDDANDRVLCDAADVTWSALGADVGTVYGVVVFKDTGNDATSPLIYFGKFSTAYVSNGADLTLVWAALGLFYI